MLSIECNQFLKAYIDLKTKVHGYWYPLGKTETIYSQSGVKTPFRKKLQVAYQIGVDYGQLLRFDIYDGDKLHIHEGYCIASTDISLTRVVQERHCTLRCERLDSRNDSQFSSCLLSISSDFDMVHQRFSLYDKRVSYMSFLKQRPPTDFFALRKNKIEQILTTLIISIRSKKIYSSHYIHQNSIDEENTRFWIHFVLENTVNDIVSEKLLWKSPKVAVTSSATKGAVGVAMKYSSDINTGIKSSVHASKSGNQTEEKQQNFNFGQTETYKKAKISCPTIKLNLKDLISVNHIDEVDALDNFKESSLKMKVYVEGIVSGKTVEHGEILLSEGSIGIPALVKQSFETSEGIDVFNESKVDKMLAEKMKKRHWNKITLKNHFKDPNLSNKIFDINNDRTTTNSFRRDEKIENKKKSKSNYGINYRNDDNDSDDESFDSDESGDVLDQSKISILKNNNNNHSLDHTTRNVKNSNHTAKIRYVIGQMKTRVMTAGGDDVYEERIKKDIQRFHAEWVEHHLGEFHTECDTQNQLNFDAAQDIEMLLSDDAVLTLDSHYIIDMSIPASRNVSELNRQIYHNVGQQHKETMDEKASSTEESPILSALSIVYRSLKNSLKEGTTKVFASGVTHSSEHHPHSNYVSNSTFPLLDEFLFDNILRVRGTNTDRIVETSSQVLSDINVENIQQQRERKAYTRLKHAVSPKQLRTKLGRNYKSLDQIIQAYVEACCVYEPVLNRSNYHENRALQINTEVESQNLCISNNSEKNKMSVNKHILDFLGMKDTAAKKKKDILMKTQMNTCNYSLNTSNTTATESRSNSHNDMAFKKLYYYDSAKASDIDIFYLFTNKANTYSESYDKTKENHVSNANVARSALIWIFGQTPTPDILKRYSHAVNEFKERRDPNVLLITVLASEFQPFDLTHDQLHLDADISDAAHPFDAFYKTMMNKANVSVTHMKTHTKSEEHMNIDDINTPKLVFSETENIVLFHYLTWGEVVARALLMDNDTNTVTLSTENVNIENFTIIDVDKQQPLPSKNNLRKVIQIYMPVWTVNAILGQDDTNTNLLDNKSNNRNKYNSNEEKNLNNPSYRKTKRPFSENQYKNDRESNGPDSLFRGKYTYIQTINELKGMKLRYDKERNILVEDQLRSCITEFL